MSFLIDSGSSVSLLPKFNSFDSGKLRPYCGRVVSVCGELLSVIGESVVELYDGSFRVEHDFLICEGINYPILGTDFFMSKSVIIDIPAQTLKFPNHSMSFTNPSVIGVTDRAYTTSIPVDADDLSVILKEFESVLREGDNCIGHTTIIEHDIVLCDPSSQPVHCRPRPVPFHLREVIFEQVDKMLKLGVIQESQSPWSSPVLLVPKHDGKYRFCIDFRKLNSLTRKDATPMPSIEDTFSQIGGSNVFTTLDLLSGFWQVGLSQQAREYTAFTVGNKHFEFIKMPFGLTGSPGTFVRLMSRVLQGLDNVLVYGDDVLIHSSSYDEHAKHLRAVLQRFKEAGLVANMKKCQFFKREVKFLGHVISEGQAAPMPDKVGSIEEFPTPKTKKQLQTFLGLAGYYRRFMPSFSSVAVPLYDLLRTKAQWAWNNLHESAFKKLKSLLTKEPVVLALPRTDQEFELFTDASDVGLGAVLSQNGHVVEYASRRLNPAERNYSVTERELLAMVWAIEKWKKYLFGKRFLLSTDHRPLTFLKTVREPKGRIARWISRIQEYDFRLEHTPGKDNCVADCLSRAYATVDPLEHETLPEGMSPVCALMFYDDPKALANEQRNDLELGPVIDALQRRCKNEPTCGGQRRLYEIWKQLSLSSEGVLTRSFTHRNNAVRVPVIPAAKRSQLIEQFHGSAHMGMEKTHDLLRINAYWPGMETDVQKFVSACKRCQLAKPMKNVNKAPLQPIHTSGPNEIWAMDIMGPLSYTSTGKRYILVATDLFTRWIETVALPDQSAVSVARAFVENVVLRYGAPGSLLTDQGTNFESQLMGEICSLLNVKKIRTSVFHPRTDGQAERMNRTIKERITSLGGSWEEALPVVTRSINCTVNSSTGFSPFQLVYGRHPSDLVQPSQEFSPRPSLHNYVNELKSNLKRLRAFAKSNSEASKRKAADYYQLKQAPNGSWKPFQVGALVKYFNRYPDKGNRKFSDKYVGPLVVEARKGVNYKIRFGNGRYRWLHHDDLLLWKESNPPHERASPVREQDSPGQLPEPVRERFLGEDSDSEDEGGRRSQAPTSVSPVFRGVRRSTRNRRPPDFYVS